MEEKKASVWVTIFWVLVFFPVAIYRMWKYEQFSKSNRILFTAIVVIGNLAGMLWSMDISKKITVEELPELEEELI